MKLIKVISKSEFENPDDFAREMSRIGKLYKDDSNIEVHYAKPEDINGFINPQIKIFEKEK